MPKDLSIIIPGACASKSNWFDHITALSTQGHEVHFLDLEAGQAEFMQHCAINLLQRLEKIFASYSNSEKLIYAHSMGGMLLLRAFVDADLRAQFDSKFIDELFGSKIFFVQVPLSVKELPYFVYVRTGFLIKPLMHFYRRTLYADLDKSLIKLKQLFLESSQTKEASLLNLKLYADLILNILLMFNSSFGTDPNEYNSLVKYYEEWKDFKLCERLVSEDRACPNFYFTHGQPDFFEDEELIKSVAGKLNAQLIHLPWGFHSPQHFFWSQKALLE